MKQLLAAMALLMWSFAVLASDTTIAFRQIAYADLFETARRENKGVMLYFHFDGCGACMEMERTVFKDERVISYFHASFVNFEINTRKGAGVEINKAYNIRLHPTFIFFDNSGDELHRVVGVFSPEEFLKQADDALKTKKSLTNYRELYSAGNREPDFLFDYTYMLRDAAELDSTVVNEYLDAVDPKDYTLEKNIRYIYEFCIHNFKIFIPFDNPRFSFMLADRNKFYEHLDSNQVKTRIVWILNHAIYKAIEEGDEETFEKAIEIQKEYDNGEEYFFKEMDGRITGVITSRNLVLLATLKFYEKTGDKKNYQKTLDMYLSKIWNDANELNNYAWGIYQRANDGEAEKIKIAIKCSIRSIELDDNYANNDTYAWLLYKQAEYKKAFKQANKTIEIAKKSHQDYSETQKLIDIIKKK